MADVFKIVRGREHANYDPSGSDPDYFFGALRDITSLYMFRTVFAPACGFTNRVVAIGTDDYIPDPDNDWYVRTRQPADGGVVEDPDVPVMIFNADCPIVVLNDDLRYRIAVLHAGLRCLVPPARMDKRADPKDKRSIIQVAFDDFSFNPRATSVFVGFGIGPCCYGAEKHREMQDATLDLPIGRATRGLRAGQRSIDLYQLITDQLTRLGVPEDKILIDSRCTACAGHYNDITNMCQRSFYSHSQDRGMGGRNASFAWFSK